MTEIFGTFEFEGQTFKAGYRYDGKWYNQGGFSKCLRIYHDANNQFIYAHDVFGDDKFEVESASIADQEVVLTMRYPLNHKDKFFLDGKKVITIKRS